jgi:hypothetical protein
MHIMQNKFVDYNTRLNHKIFNIFSYDLNMIIFQNEMVDLHTFESSYIFNND